MSPAILSTGDMGHIDGPTLVLPFRAASSALHAGLVRDLTLVDQPPPVAHEPVDTLAIDQQAITKSQERPDPSIAVR